MESDLHQRLGKTTHRAMRLLGKYPHQLTRADRTRLERLCWIERVAKSSSDECRDWPWALNDKGYGAIRWNGATRKVTHIVLEMDGRPRPFPRAFALHSCDRPACANPRHLRWGTPANNSADAVGRGRTSRNHGETGGMSKLTDDQVRAIRAAHGTLRSLGDEYGVHFTVIQKIRAGKTWRHLLDEEVA